MAKPGPKPRPPADRFWALVERGPGCWLWLGSTLRGYGQFGVQDADGRWVTVFAHRYCWELVRGPIPEGLNVLHACDNPPCVRPGEGHLFLGTQADNVADMYAKGRAAPLPVWRGEAHPMAKLDAEAVARIRASTLSQRAIAARFKISQAQVGRILRKESWAP